MAYDERLAGRVRELFKRHPGVVEKRMFGGLAYVGAPGLRSRSALARWVERAVRTARSSPPKKAARRRAT